MEPTLVLQEPSVVIAHGSLIASARAVTTVNRQTWLEAARTYTQKTQFVVSEKDKEQLDRHILKVQESLSWEKHNPFVAKRPLLLRFAASASVPLADPYSGLASRIIESFTILEKIQSGEVIEYNMASNMLGSTLVNWRQYKAAARCAWENSEEGLKIILSAMSQCDSSKNEKLRLLAKISDLLSTETVYPQREAAQAHFLGFLFENSTGVLFDPIKFLETVEQLFSAWLPLQISVAKREDFQGYYRHAFLLYKGSGRPMRELEEFAIECLWAQRCDNLSMRADRRQKKIVVMGAGSLSSLAAIIESLVAGYSVLTEMASLIPRSSKLIKVAAPSMIEALYRYGIAYHILSAKRATSFPLFVAESLLKQLLASVTQRLAAKIRAEEQGSPFAYCAKGSLQFVESTGLVYVHSAEACPCEAIILAGSGAKLSGLPGLSLRPLEWLYRDDFQQLMVASERAFVLAGTKITAFLVGGMEHQEINVERDKSCIASVRHLPLFTHHWGRSTDTAIYEELCTASIERWLMQSYLVVFGKLVRPKHIPRGLMIEIFLCEGLINEYQSNLLRTLAILADPELKTSCCDALPLDNASKILPSFKKPICDLVKQEIDILCEHLTQFISLKKRILRPPEVDRKTKHSYALIEYLALQNSFINNLQ